MFAANKGSHHAAPAFRVGRGDAEAGRSHRSRQPNASCRGCGPAPSVFAPRFNAQNLVQVLIRQLADRRGIAHDAHEHAPPATHRAIFPCSPRGGVPRSTPHKSRRVASAFASSRPAHRRAASRRASAFGSGALDGSPSLRSLTTSGGKPMTGFWRVYVGIHARNGSAARPAARAPVPPPTPASPRHDGGATAGTRTHHAAFGQARRFPRPVMCRACTPSVAATPRRTRHIRGSPLRAPCQPRKQRSSLSQAW